MGIGQSLQHEVTHTFEPGEVGIDYDDDGTVREVIENGQAHTKGIKNRNLIVRVDTDPYSKDVLTRAEESGLSYRVSFQVELGDWSTMLDERERGEPTGILMLASCSAEDPHGASGHLKKVIELFKQKGQIVLAGEATDDFHDWMRARLKKDRLSGEIWKAAYLGKIEGHLKIFQSQCRSLQPIDAQFTTVHGGQQCDWERDVLEHPDTQRRYCQSQASGQSLPVLHFKDVDTLGTYLNQHVLFEFVVHMHYQVTTEDGMLNGIKWANTSEYINKTLSHAAQCMDFRVKFNTFSWRSSAHFISIGCVDSSSLDPSEGADDGISYPYALLLSLERLCNDRLPRMIEQSLANAAQTQCICNLKSLGIVPSRLAHISRLLDNPGQAPPTFEASLRSFLAEQDGIVLIPKLLELHAHGDDVQKTITFNALREGVTSTWRNVDLPDERLAQWRRENAAEMEVDDSDPEEYDTAESEVGENLLIDEAAKQDLRVMCDCLKKVCESPEPPCSDVDAELLELDRKMLPCYGHDKKQYRFTRYQGFYTAECKHNKVLLFADPIRFAPKDASPTNLEVIYHYTDSNGFPLIAASRTLLVSKDVSRSHFGVGGYFSKKAPHEWTDRQQILVNNYRPRQKEIDVDANDNLNWEKRVASRFCGRADYCVAFIVPKNHRYDIHEELEAQEKRFHENQRLHDMMAVEVSCNKWGERQPKERDVVVYNSTEGKVIDSVHFSEEWATDFENRINSATRRYPNATLAVLDSNSRYLKLSWVGHIGHVRPELPQLRRGLDANLFPLQIKAYDPLPNFFEGVCIAVDPFSKMRTNIRNELEAIQQLAEDTQGTKPVHANFKDLAIQIEALAWHLRRQDAKSIEAVELYKGVRHLYSGDVQQQWCNISLGEFIINRHDSEEKDSKALAEAKDVFCKALNTPDNLRLAFRKFLGAHARDEVKNENRREMERCGWYGIATCLTDELPLKEEILASVGNEYEEVLSPYHPKTIETKILLADTKMNLGKVGEAKRFYKELHKLRARVLGQSHKLTNHLKNKLLKAEAAEIAVDSRNTIIFSSSLCRPSSW